MTGAELKQLRADLGNAIGRRLSLADMARLCGLAPANDADTIRKWEDGAGPSGPVAELLSILAYASDLHPVPSDFTEPYHQISLVNGEPVQIGREITVPVLRHYMRAEILRRLST